MSRAWAERFEILREVGAGAFGTVYQARDREGGSLVALKVLHGASDVAEARFEREAASLAELQHPGVVRYVAHGRERGGQAYLAMEWLEGETLERRLKDGRLSYADAVRLARCVVAALALAAQRGIVHRDVKPANLFLVGGDIERTKLLDFGLARRMQDAQALTRTGTALGTPLYMSPEQARGRGEVDPRSDVFSLGSVLYECMTGESPFVTGNPLATLAKICFEEPPRLEHVCPSVPFRVAALVHAMLAKVPAERPSYEDLAHRLDDIAVSASVPPSVPRASPGSSGARASLSAVAEQRVICAVFVGAPPEEGAALERELAELLIPFGARCERLLGGARVVMLDRNLSAADQAVAAARCALALGRVCGAAPIAVCTGRAVVGIGVPYGDLFERAASLLGATDAAEVQLDDASAALIDARFELRRAADRHYLERERASGETPRTLLGRVTPFVGREREVAQLEALFEESVEESVARVALVTAAAGVGKSRLRYELLERLRRGVPFEMLVGRGDSVRARSQFGVLAPAIASWAELLAQDAPAVKCAKLTARVAALYGDPASGPLRESAETTAAFLGELIGVAFGDDAHPSLHAARRDPQVMADRLLASWLEWIERVCARSPVLFIIEDLHWSDPASVRFVEAALRAARDRPLLVLAFARPELREAFPKLWVERDLLEIRLAKLGARACERLLEGLSAEGFDAKARASLIERADGNPFLLEELVRGARAAGSDGALPDSILGVVQARLDTLGDAAKAVIRAASVFGQVFRADALAALLDHGVGIDVARVLSLLEQREVTFTRGEGPEREHVFRHALIRDAAYALLLDDERALGHRLAAEWLEAQGATDPAQLADHYERGGVLDRAASSYAFAAARALDAGSLREVVRCGERALACGLFGERLGEVQAQVAYAWAFIGDQARAAEWAEAARRNLGDRDGAWWRASQVLAVSTLMLGNPRFAEIVEDMLQSRLDLSSLPEHVIALCVIGCGCVIAGQPELAKRLLGCIRGDVADAQIGRARAYVHSTQAIMGICEGRLAGALREARASCASFRAAGAQNELVEQLTLEACVLIEVGRFGEAERLLVDAAEFALRLGALQGRRGALGCLAEAHRQRGAHEAAERLIEEALEGTTDAQDGMQRSSQLGTLAALHLARGDAASAAKHVAAALQVGGLAPMPQAFALSVRSRVRLVEGAREDALRAAEEAMAIVRAHGVFEHLSEIACAHIAALDACERHAEAERAIAEAHAALLERAAKIDDEELRRSFLADVPDNARLVALAARSRASPS